MLRYVTQPRVSTGSATWWAKRTDLSTEPLCAVFPTNHGVEELDERDQIPIAATFDFDDPPDELVA